MFEGSWLITLANLSFISKNLSLSYPWKLPSGLCCGCIQPPLPNIFWYNAPLPRYCNRLFLSCYSINWNSVLVLNGVVQCNRSNLFNLHANEEHKTPLFFRIIKTYSKTCRIKVLLLRCSWCRNYCVSEFHLETSSFFPMCFRSRGIIITWRQPNIYPRMKATPEPWRLPINTPLPYPKKRFWIFVFSLQRDSSSSLLTLILFFFTLTSLLLTYTVLPTPQTNFVIRGSTRRCTPSGLVDIWLKIKVQTTKKNQLENQTPHNPLT